MKEIESIFINLVFVIIFTTNIVTGTLNINDERNICQTDTCNKTARYILSNMEDKINPCDNFYRFACAGYLEKTEVGKDTGFVDAYVTAQNEQHLEMLLDIILSNKVKTKLKIHKKLQQFYDICLQDRSKNNSTADFLNLLSDFGGWPILVGDSWDSSKFSWNTSMIQFGKIGLPDNFFISYDVGVDNNAKTITLDHPSLGISETFLREGLAHSFVEIYYKYIVNLAVILGADRSRAEKELKESLLFEIQLATIFSKEQEHLVEELTHNVITVKKLQSEYQYMNWYQYLKEVFRPYVRVAEYDNVSILDTMYFKMLGDLLKKTPNRVLANYAFSRVVMQVADLLSTEIRQLRENYIHEASGSKLVKLRWEMCFEDVLKLFPLAMGSLYVRQYVNRTTQAGVLEMFSLIRQSFDNILQKTDWMDDGVRRIALEKLYSMTTAVGYPEELLDDAKVDGYYEGLKLVDGNYFETLRNINKFYAMHSFKSLRKPVVKIDWTKKFHGAFELKVYYDVLANVLEISSGIMQGYFYHNERPLYLDFAALGTMMSYEMAHGFDFIGGYYDRYGNRMNWWNNATFTSYNSASKCVVQQYDKYIIKELGTSLMGKKLLTLNVADIAAVKTAYHAYIAWQQKHGVEQGLPGLEKYTPKQLFWIFNANHWCQKSNIDHLLYTALFDTHAPNEFRVIGSLSNLAEFAQDFNCPRNSPMNPIKKCNLW